MKLEIPNGLVPFGSVLEPGEGSVLETNEVWVLDGRFSGAWDVSIDELGILEELVESSKSDDWRG